jgi:hypothetical protein
VLVAGVPGRTLRYALPEELAFEHEVVSPTALETYAETERLLAQAMEDPAAAARLRATANQQANGRKRRQGISDQVERTGLLADKGALGQQLDELAQTQPALQAALAELRRLAQEEAASYPTRQAIDALFRNPLLSTSHTAWRWAEQRRVRRDLLREPGLQDRDLELLLARARQLDARLWLPFERVYLEARLQRYQALPEPQRVASLDAWLAAQGGVSGALDALFGAPDVLTGASRAALYDSSQQVLERSTDPWVGLAIALERGYLAQRREQDRAREGARLRLLPTYVAAVQALGGTAYPDANGTLRVTFGQVTGYAPQDGLWAVPQTRLQGLVQKARGPGYQAPPWVLHAAERLRTSPDEVDRSYLDPELGDLPLNFLADLDTTGGNSGSPTLDADGELVGLAFDGNYEALASSWQFDPSTTRSIHIDIRYILWMLAQDPEAGWLLQELLPTRAAQSQDP